WPPLPPPHVPRAPTTPPCPYTTLFRSHERALGRDALALALEQRLQLGDVLRLGAPGGQAGDARFDQLAHLEHLGQLASTPKDGRDRKSTRLNSSHGSISYAVFCLKKNK